MMLSNMFNQNFRSIKLQCKIKQLREMTGAGLMDCKKAIEESNGDINKSNKLLQENRWKYGKFIC